MENSQKYYEIEILTRELKEGKEAAFDYLFRTRYKNLCRFAATFVVQFDVAEDIVQEVFEKIWKKSTRIDERASIDSYLFVAVRTFLKNKRECVDLEDVKQNLKISEEVVEFETPELNRLWGEIENLPLQCKVVFKLVILEDMKYKDVADSLEISVNTVKTQMKIAYKTLREKLKQEQFSLLLFLFAIKED